MTAGVQSFDPGAAYLPAAPSNPSSQSKAAGRGAGAEPGAEAPDFQSEMDLQDAAPQPRSAQRPEKDEAKTNQGSARNAAKKQNARPDRASVQAKDRGEDDAASAPVVATPAETAEPQRPILPITFAPMQPDQTPDDAAQPNTSQGEATQEAVSKVGLSPSVVAQEAPLPRLQNEVIPAKAEQSD